MLKTMLKLKNKKRKGFTLIELIAVMTILGLLALLIIPRFTNVSDSAKVKIFETNARTLASQASLFVANNDGAFPQSGTRTRDATPAGGGAITSTDPAAGSDLLQLEEGMPTDYAERIVDATTEVYRIQARTTGGTDQGALICQLVLNSKNYVVVYDFASSTTTRGATAPGAVDATTNRWQAAGDWGK